MVRRDSRELPTSIRWTLGVLRVFAIICVVAYLLNPGQRSESRLITNSRLAVLIDTSLSMGLPAQSATAQDKQTRMESVIDWITTDGELSQLRQQHDLSIYRFGDTATPVPLATWTKEQAAPVQASAVPLKKSAGSWLSTVLPTLVWVFLLIAIGFVLFWLSGFFGSGTANRSWRLTTFVLSLLFALLLAGILDLSTPEQSVWDALRYSKQGRPTTEPIEGLDAIDAPGGEEVESEADINWADVLRPQGTSTSLGAAIQFIINKERGGPLAGRVSDF